MAELEHPDLTRFEAETLALVSLGEDPWRGWNGTSGSRRFSQAMGRLHRKGFIAYSYQPGERDKVTPAGESALLAKFHWELDPKKRARRAR